MRNSSCCVSLAQARISRRRVPISQLFRLLLGTEAIKLKPEIKAAGRGRCEVVLPERLPVVAAVAPGVLDHRSQGAVR